jgi:hypothetical protein
MLSIPPPREARELITTAKILVENQTATKLLGKLHHVARSRAPPIAQSNFRTTKSISRRKKPRIFAGQIPLHPVA